MLLMGVWRLVLLGWRSRGEKEGERGKRKRKKPRETATLNKTLVDRHASQRFASTLLTSIELECYVS